MLNCHSLKLKKELENQMAQTNAIESELHFNSIFARFPFAISQIMI